jgi:mannose-6-phosphate isomerase-like protein (cupin superfamily)
MRSHYSDVPAYETKDGSEIRELMHPDRHGNRRQSLAEAIVYPGQETVLHQHIHSEELYYITAGTGLMTLGDAKFEVHTGDTICIMPGTPHCIQNSGSEPLKILCCCSPPYSHDDTILLTGPAGTRQA